MRTAERVELALVAVLGLGFWLLAPALPERLPLGRLLLVASALLLLQGLVRDLWLLAERKRAPCSALRVARCVCMESSVGITGVVAAAVVLWLGAGEPVELERWGWAALALVVLSAGFLMKDLVVHWSPWAIRRDEDHLNVVVRLFR